MSVGKTEWNMISSSPSGEYKYDKHINFDYIEAEYKKGLIGIPDKMGLGNHRFVSPNGNMRPLIGSSAKVSKSVSDSTGKGAVIGQLFLSPAKECYRDVEDIFPSSGWRSGSANAKLFYGRVNPIPELIVPKHFGDRKTKPKPKHRTMCKYAGKCQETCLLETGNIKLLQCARARYTKTWFFLTEPIAFMRLLIHEIHNHARKAKDKDKKAYFRLNGLSDVFWERYMNMDKMVKEIEGLGGFYDYTKAPHEKRVTKQHKMPKNYRMVYSWDEKPTAKKNATKWAKLGHSISVVFPSIKRVVPKELTELIKSDLRVLNGDKHDGRFTEPKGSIVLLRNKGSLKIDTHLNTIGDRQTNLITPIRTIINFAKELRKELQ
jgi:hypothetical protein